jgi:hypothetical protein
MFSSNSESDQFFACSQSGLNFSETYQKNLETYLQKNAESRKNMKDKKGSDKKALHEYKPEDFGLTADLIQNEFKEYIQKYNL